MYKDLIWHRSIFSPPERTTIFEPLPKSLARAASLWPDSPAVICDDKTYSFQDLACRVAGLSNEINETASGSGPIALVQSLGLDAIAAWFACSLSSRSFILLEPDHPPERLRELIETSHCSLVLCDHSTSEVLSNLTKVKLLISEGRSGTLTQEKGLSADEPAMIFPTSGSTGKPKLITYATSTIQVKVQSSIQLMRVSKGERVLIAGSHGNYGFLHHALVFLLAGGTVCLADIKQTGFNAVINAITHLGVRHIRFTPSLFRKLAILPQAYKALSLLDGVRFSGEPLLRNDLKLAHSVLKPECLIQNIYGSTESALFIWSSIDDNLLATETTVPIGKIYPHSSYAINPIEDTDVNNSTGELMIRSSFHALGDSKEGIIDKERFPQLENSTDDERIYATGDIVHQLTDGNLIHLGRRGRMVKIRGHRVFLTEVENHLRMIPGVTAAAVLEHEDKNGIQLYGFITTDQTIIKSDYARTFLAERLPDFMIPRAIETVSQIPLMTGGKVDYLALVKLIPTYNTEIESEIYKDDNFARLTQLWDSVLWNSAHTHDSNFFALGGDSLGLMILSTEIDRIFGKSLPIEKFRTNSTLINLAAILEIESPNLQAEDKQEKLKLKLFCPSILPSKGIALAMTGYGGWAQAYPFKQAGLFQDHDIWVADFSIKEGSMLESRRWWKAAFEIVESIRNGKMPPPRVIFGYSVGGGMAWLVGRLLSGTSQCPEFVIMVDAAPLHRLRSFRNRALTKALELVAHTESPPVIHIRRATLPNVGVGIGSTNTWETNDNIQMLVDLPTVDHLEMIRWNMLILAKEPVRTFLNDVEPNDQYNQILQPPDILGVHIHNAVNGNPYSFQKVIDELAKAPEVFNVDHILPLAFLMLIKNDKDKANELIYNAIKQWPNSRITQFLSRRMRRNANMLLPEDILSIFPPIITNLETSIAKSQTRTDYPKPRPIRVLFLAFDALCAILAAGWARWKLKYSRVKELKNH